MLSIDPRHPSGLGVSSSCSPVAAGTASELIFVVYLFIFIVICPLCTVPTLLSMWDFCARLPWFKGTGIQRQGGLSLRACLLRCVCGVLEALGQDCTLGVSSLSKFTVFPGCPCVQAGQGCGPWGRRGCRSLVPKPGQGGSLCTSQSQPWDSFQPWSKMNSSLATHLCVTLDLCLSLLGLNLVFKTGVM